MQEDTNSTRRGVLKSVGSGFGLTAVSGGNPFSTTSTRKVRITTVRSGDEALERKKVPKRWWQQMETAEKVQRNLERKWQKAPGTGVKDVSLATRPKTVGGRRAGAVSVSVDPETGAQVEVPDRVDGVELNVEDYEQGELESCPASDCDQQRYDESHSYVPGGVKTERDIPDSQYYSVATTTCRVYDSNNNPYMMHCAHQFGACDSSSMNDEVAYQAYQKMGSVLAYDLSMDFAVVSESTDSEINGLSGTVENAAGDVLGRVTKSGLKDLMSNQTEVYKSGQRTCRTSGVVDEINQSNSLDCASDDDNYVDCTMETCQGDSGAPYYAEKWDPTMKEYYTAIIGVHSRGGAIGCAAYRIHNDWGYEFR